MIQLIIFDNNIVCVHKNYKFYKFIKLYQILFDNNIMIFDYNIAHFKIIIHLISIVLNDIKKMMICINIFNIYIFIFN